MPQFQLQQQRQNRCQQPRPSSKYRALSLKRALQVPKCLQKRVTAAKWAGNQGLIRISLKCNCMIYALRSSNLLSPSENHKGKSPSKAAKKRPLSQIRAGVLNSPLQIKSHTHTNLQGLLAKLNQFSSHRHPQRSREQKRSPGYLQNQERKRGTP